MTESIKSLAAEWLRLDKNGDTIREIQDLLSTGNDDELERRLRTRITFGTAGLRGRMGAGFSCMNPLTVIQASQGLAAYLLKIDPDRCHSGVVIGYDSRHNSIKFAKLAAAAFVQKGIKVWWFEIYVHTPLVPFAVNEFGAAAGVMVTASHNPAQDNGYKVYWSNGCQIVTPHDKGIAKAILENQQPLSWDEDVVGNSLLVESCLERIKSAYLNALLNLAPSMELQKMADGAKFVYTPMHGVGLPYMVDAARQIGLLQSMVVVDEQAQPDPDFPTVKFPNPEEAGALDLAYRVADQNAARYIIATDPDADRLAVAQKVGEEWHQFTGNQLGVLLASFMLSRSLSSSKDSRLAMLTTVVSTQMLQEMGRQEGFKVEETLTGFKWIGAATHRLRAGGFDVRFAFEEAIGYMFPEIVSDKDGIGGAVLFLHALLHWRATEGITPWEKLESLYQRYGYYSTRNTYFVSPDPRTTTEAFEYIRGLGNPYPSTLGEHKILNYRDLTRGYDSTTKDHVPLLPVSSSSQMITCETEKTKFTIRGSGTEPKIKVYIEAKAGSSGDALNIAENMLQAISEEWLRPEKNGLVPA